eukprot:sb/3473631/
MAPLKRYLWFWHQAENTGTQLWPIRALSPPQSACQSCSRDSAYQNYVPDASLPIPVPLSEEGGDMEVLGRAGDVAASLVGWAGVLVRGGSMAVCTDWVHVDTLVTWVGRLLLVPGWGTGLEVSLGNQQVSSMSSFQRAQDEAIWPRNG